jgi:hypothetical protein
MTFTPSLRALAASGIVLFTVLLSACDDGNGSGGSGAPIQSGAAVLVSTTVASVGADCAAGGVKIASGRDTNGNGILDTSEVTNVQYACNGAPGLRGIVKTVTLAAGNAHCPAGGDAVETGLDANDNGVLDAAEITSTGYVCAAAAGAAGATGATGSAGIAGKNSDINIVALAAGSICEYGGYTITAGPDNGSGQIATVTSTAHICNGVAGADITWVDVTGTSQQAQSNTGYLADNAARVTITLPGSPAVGDLVRVSGAGAGGWIIAQNAGQAIRTEGIPTDANGWIAQAASGQRLWQSIASSSDGSHLAATGGNSDYIYTSGDAGVTWTQQTGSGQRNWIGIASSSDGSHLAAVEGGGGYIYTSVNGGVTWTQRISSGARNWYAVASSSDGSHLAAGDSNLGYIYTSVDGGATWTQQTGSGQHYWFALASSSDGSHLATADDGGYVYTSVNGGATWTQRTGSGAASWIGIASSTDGSHLIAITGGGLSISADFGATWTSPALPGGGSWNAVASSGDGSLLLAGQYNGYIFTSTDSGLSWTQSNSGIGKWQAIASSSDGIRLAAVTLPGYIYTEFFQSNTTFGTGGSLLGYQYDMVELQYLGGGVFGVLGYTLDSGTFIIQ